ncbi:MAG TPA: FtsH protease activity modulator HflK [Pseudomonadales bacterium]|nr:FtsH protease activity modulator HflK [Pseudomonadales bacterium]
MAWNEPGNNGNKGGNPWGGPPRGNKNDMQDVLDKLTGMFGSGSNDEVPTAKLAALVIGGLLTLWATLGIYQLDEQKRAVVLRLGAFKEIVGPGVHWNPPFIDTVIKENVTQQRSYTAQGVMLTEDINIVDVKLSVQYNIGDLKKFALGMRDPEKALNEATDSALRHAVGSSKMDDVLTTGLDKIAVDVRTRLQQYLDTYQSGIVVTAINLEKPQPPSAVQAAFDDVIKAREDEQRVQNEAHTYANGIIPEARGLAKRVNQEALAYRDRVVARAQGETTRFEALLPEYHKAPEVTRQRLYLETIEQVMANNNKVLVDVDHGSNMIYLPLDKLTGKSADNSNTAAPTSTSGASLSANGNATLSQADMENLSAKIESKVREDLQSKTRSESGRRRENRQ